MYNIHMLLFKKKSIIFICWNFILSYSCLFHIGIRMLFEDVEQELTINFFYVSFFFVLA